MNSELESSELENSELERSELENSELQGHTFELNCAAQVDGDDCRKPISF